jgi:hypothetical protein
MIGLRNYFMPACVTIHRLALTSNLFVCVPAKFYTQLTNSGGAGGGDIPGLDPPEGGGQY